MFPVDWAIGMSGAIASVVREAFPGEERRWPLVQLFDVSDALLIGDSHVVVVLRDKLRGVPSGPGSTQPFPHDDHPPLPKGWDDAEPWQDYINRRFEVGPQDAGFIVPVHDSGVSNAAKDFELFTPGERESCGPARCS